MQAATFVTKRYIDREAQESTREEIMEEERSTEWETVGDEHTPKPSTVYTEHWQST